MGLPTTYLELDEIVKKSGSTMRIENAIIKEITLKSGLKSWVDIENEYYKLLTNDSSLKQSGNISPLNQQFEVIRQLLIEYLKNINIEEGNIYSVVDQLNSGFNLRDFQENWIKSYIDYWYGRLKDYQKNDYSIEILRKGIPKETLEIIDTLHGDFSKKNIKNLLLSLEASRYKLLDLIPKETLILDFNYTSTFRRYFELLKSPNIELIFIHGEINNIINNPIILGFGDELDDKYSLLGKTGNNEFLENVKSINYSKTDNYKKFLEFVNSDKFQVYIIGHSCGLSDRTLLNTIFEHDNCKSIKPYYYLRNDLTDNYSDIVRNISRCFKDKARMRDVVVNKTYCEPIT